MGRVLLASCSVLPFAVMLLTAEGIARLVAPNYLVRTRGPLVFSETYGWASRSQVSATRDGARVTLNEAGYRGRVVSGPPTSQTRVVVLGDSIAFGIGVADAETFSSRIDARDNGIEVANLAVQGYGPDQELLVLEREGLRLRPDVVILAFCMANDKPRFRLHGDSLVLDTTSLRRGVAWRAQRALAGHSHPFNRVASAFAAARVRIGGSATLGLYRTRKPSRRTWPSFGACVTFALNAASRS